MRANAQLAVFQGADTGFASSILTNGAYGCVVGGIVCTDFANNL